MIPARSRSGTSHLPFALLALGVLAWFAPGQAARASDARIEAFPNELTLVGATARQQIVVTETAPDGSTRDRTHTARFAVEPTTLATVSPTGVVTPREDGVGHVLVQVGARHQRLSLRVDKRSATPPSSFRLDVSAVLSKAGCNMGACHGNLNGKGGFKLSLRGFDPDFDFASITRDAFARRIDLVRPEASLFVRKPLGTVPHEGGPRFAPGDPEAQLLDRWIAAGATDDRATSPRLLRLDVYPRERINAAPDLTQQLAVTAEFSDGTRRDVTRLAAFDVSDPTRASVSIDGHVRAAGPTETVVAIRYLAGRAVCRLAFLADRPDFAWHARKSRNVVDEHVFKKLHELKILPSEPTVDAVFLRRASLDALGRLPTVAEARGFAADPDPDKRDRLVDQLLDRPEFADFWALKWADLLRNEEKTMGEKGVWVFQRWLRDQIAADVPLDEFAGRLITAQGSTWGNPPSSFYRTNRDPKAAAEAFAQVFLGVRIQCARCHNHPFDNWTQDDYYGLAATFSNIQRKQIANQRKDKFDTHEITGDEVIYLEGAPVMDNPRTGLPILPRAPRGPALGPEARDDLARWLTRTDRQFARNMANRVWFHLLGRGVVDPVDDFRESNPPSNPALLEALTDALVQNGYRLRPLVALIMKSDVYQLSSEPNETNAADEANFARASVRLLPAEVLLDAIGQALGKPGVSLDNAPRGLGATQVPGTRMGGTFLKIFGKPDRLLTCECERSESTTLAQAFQLINGGTVRDRLEAENNRIGRLIGSGTNDGAILDELTLAALSRPPSASERSGFLEHVRKATDRRKAWEDVAWAIVNSKEFLLRH